MQLSLITLNTWKCEGEYPERLELISDELISREVDFFVGQEVYDSQLYSSEKHFSDELKMSALFEKARYKQRTVHEESTLSHSGLCIWTNRTILDSAKIELPITDADGERISQVILVAYKEMQIAIVNTHLTHLKGQEELRKKQIATTIDQTKNLFNPDGIVFCGDFNCEKDSKEITHLVSNYGFEDAYPTCASTHIGGRCIDHVFYYPSHRFSTQRASIILNEKINGILPSDHFGMYVELTIHDNE